MDKYQYNITNKDLYSYDARIRKFILEKIGEGGVSDLNIEMQIEEEWLQWRWEGGQWKNLMPLANLKVTHGNSIIIGQDQSGNDVYLISSAGKMQQLENDKEVTTGPFPSLQLNYSEIKNQLFPEEA